MSARLSVSFSAVAIVAIVALVACSAPAAPTTAPTAQPAVASPAASATTAALPDLEYAKAEVAKLTMNPPFVAPGPAFDAGKARGKTIFDIPLNSTIPTAQLKQSTYKRILDRLGVKLVVHPNQGQVNDYVQGMNNAISQKADLIILDGAPNPALLGPQIAMAKAAGIPVLVTHFYDESSSGPPEVTAIVPAPFNKSGKAEADWIIAASAGKANVLVIQSAEAPPSAGIVKTIQDEFSRYCGPGCKTTVINVPVNEWSSKTQGEVQSALIRDPGITHVLPLYDAMVPFATAGVVSAQRDKDVKVLSFNGTPSVLKMIQDGTPVVMNVGENPDWLAYANMDQALRILTGNPPVKSENTPLRIFTKDNVNEAGVPPALGKGYGDAYVTGYEKLWGLTQ